MFYDDPYEDYDPFYDEPEEFDRQIELQSDETYQAYLEVLEGVRES